MIDQNSTWTTTIPASVPSGNYLIRFETIALHSLPAQLYPECAQITITGGGSRQPTADELVSFPGAYSASDPGCTSFRLAVVLLRLYAVLTDPAFLPLPLCDTVTVNLYTNDALTETTYIIPGPPLYGSGSGAPAPPPSVRLLMSIHRSEGL
ncbi:glycosyl hydrolase family 61-domain-containing protein [Cerioporus squamosus]|nr:glycosyl hydrolase family 61-domain-containing protein [Cerioporus squamosus]